MIKVGQSLVCPSQVKELTADKAMKDGKLYTVTIGFEDGTAEQVTGVTAEKLKKLTDCFEIVEL